MSLPKKPERPLDSDCCSQGCDPCILDLYAEELRIWEEECDQIVKGKRSRNTDLSSSKKKDCEVRLCVGEYNSFQIESMQRETSNSYRYTFSLPMETTLGLKTGQHVVIRGDVRGDSVTRQYTPVSDVNAKGYFELVIKIYEDGCMSQYVKTWEVGTSIQIRGPCGSFLYQPNKYRRVVMLCVGTGIAPMAQVIHSVLNNEEDETLITLYYGCRTYQDIFLKSELDEWARYWNFSCTYCLSQESCNSNYRYGDTIHPNKINCDLVRTVIANPQDNFLVLICGTKSFEHDMIQCLKDIGVDEVKYHKF